MATEAAGLRLREPGILARLNTRWHRTALITFGAITIAHWAEHLVQAYQVWVLDHPRRESLGLLGEAFPWLFTSEWLHYGYALVMMAALLLLLPGFRGRSRAFWLVALGIQVWHHAEHVLLLVQAQSGTNFFGGKVPTSVLQAVFPSSRVEIHLVYNALVTIPMLVALYFHMYPPPHEEPSEDCGCSLTRP